MFVSNMADVLRAAGLKVVETEGWESNGYTPPETGVTEELIEYRGNLWHHTATNRAAFTRANAPTLDMCVNGRSDLAGPLCNAVVGRDGTVYLVAAGKANHAGRGSAYGIPTDGGNYYLFGWEMESSGVAPWDWTPEQLEAVPRIAAATERAYGFELELGHLEYSSEGKIDPAGWPGGMDGLRASINAVLDGSAGNIEEDDVALSQADKDLIQSMHDVTRGYIVDETVKRVNEFAQAAHDVTRGYLADTSKGVAAVIQEQLEGKLSPDVDAAEVAARVIAAVGEGLAKDVAKVMGERLNPKDAD